MIYAVSGIDGNPTRFPRENAAFKISEDTLWLPEKLYKKFTPENNATLRSVLKYLENADDEIQKKHRHKPGNCAEASAEALRMYLGFESDGWEHHTYQVDVDNQEYREQEMCDFCKAAFLTGRKMKNFRRKIKKGIKKYRKQRGAHNPREGCQK